MFCAIHLGLLVYCHHAASPSWDKLHLVVIYVIRFTFWLNNNESWHFIPHLYHTADINFTRGQGQHSTDLVSWFGCQLLAMSQGLVPGGLHAFSDI